MKPLSRTNMTRHGTMLFLWLVIVCFWTSSVPTVLLMSPPRDRPIVYPADTDTPNQIPEALLIQMKDIENYSQLLDFLGAPAKPGLGPSRPIGGSASTPTDEYNATGVDRKKLGGGVDISRAAGCEPEMRTVELEKPEDPAQFYWPMCIRVARCGGCCTSSLLSCVPVETSTIQAKILHAQYLGSDLADQFDIIGFKSLKVEKHDKCSCQCKERPEDCHELQRYKEEECRCMCTNLDARDRCVGDRWIWDPKDCACKCRNTEECSTGFFYNGISCRCEVPKSSLVGRRKFPNLNTSIPVIPRLDANTSETDTILADSKKSDTTVPTTMATPRTTSSTTTTTTTKTPPVRVRARVGLPPLRESVGDSRVYKAQHVGIRPTDDEDDAAPFTLARSRDQKLSRKIEPESRTSDTSRQG